MNIRKFLRLSAHVQMLPILESGEETLVGGQAVMEGVMMRAPHSYCVAIRKPNGEIAKEEMPVPRMSEKYPAFKLPILRGLGTLGQAMGLGFKALSFSAKTALAEEAAAGASQNAEASSDPGASSTKEMPGWIMGVNLAFSLLFFLFLYKFVPLFLATQIGHRYPALNGRVTINLIDGSIRILILLGFLYGISRMKDMHRVFQYHGAEHKVVFNYESGKPVTVENAQEFVTWHPRCGTSFLLVVMVISLLVYAFLPFDGFWTKLITRIAGLPLVVGISYELIRAAAKSQGAFLKALTAPGLWLQRVTTQPPSDDQAAVAISALEGAMELEKSQGGQLVIA